MWPDSTVSLGRAIRASVPVLAAAWLAACSTAEFRPSPSAPRYPAHRGAVEVLRALPAAGTFVQLGVVIARGVRLTEDEKMMRDLRAAAAENGADAIVLQSEETKVRVNQDGSQSRFIAAWAIRRRK